MEIFKTQEKLFIFTTFIVSANKQDAIHSTIILFDMSENNQEAYTLWQYMSSIFIFWNNMVPPICSVAKTFCSFYQPDFGIYILPTFMGIWMQHFV
jgi:hypothetical protein